MLKRKIALSAPNREAEFFLSIFPLFLSNIESSEHIFSLYTNYRFLTLSTVHRYKYKTTVVRAIGDIHLFGKFEPKKKRELHCHNIVKIPISNSSI